MDLFKFTKIKFIFLSIFFANIFAFSAPQGIGFEVLIIKPDDTPLEAPSVNFKFKITDPIGTCVIYIEELAAQDMTGSQGQKSFTIGNPSLQTYPDPMATPLTIAQVFSNSGRTFACQSGGSYTSAAIDKRQLLLEFDDTSGPQALSAVEINSVPFALEAATITGMPTCAANQAITFNGSSFTCVNEVSAVTSANSYISVATGTTTPVLTLNVGTAVNTVAAGNDSRFTDTRTPTDNSVTSAKISDGSISSADISASAIQSSHLSQMGAGIGQVLKWDGASWISSNDNSGSGNLVTSVAGQTGAVTLSSGDITGLSFGATAGTFAQGNDSRFTDTRTPTDNSVTSAKIFDGTIMSADISAAAITFDKLNQSSAISGQVIKWNGSAWVASSDETGAGGTVTSVGASGPLSSSGGGTPIISITQSSGTTSGYLSSGDWTTFSAKLSDFSSLLSSDITGKLGYIPVNPATAVLSVAGQTGVVTLSSSDITGLSFGTTAGTYAQGNDSRFTDQRTPTDNTVTTAKIVDGAITSADISDASIESSKLAQMGASSGQILKWNGSAWVASSDETGAGGTVTSVAAAGTANNPITIGGSGSSPTIDLAKATGSVNGYLSSADWTTFSAKLSDFSSLLSSDITGKLGYVPLNPANNLSDLASTTTARTNLGLGTASLLNSGDVVLVSNMPLNCSVGQTLTFSSPTGSWVCSSIVLGSGTVTSSMITSLDWTKVVNTPTTAAGYGIAKSTAGVDGYLSSSDFTIFSAKLSDFSSLLSSDITGKLGYVPVNPATAVLSVAGQTGVVTLSSSDISGLAFGATTGTYAQGDDSRFTDTRTPTDNSVTTAKIVDGTITSADISAAAITFDKLNQSSAASGQVIKWSGSSWIASADDTGAVELPAIGGTAALPGYAFSGDTNTGVFSTTANTVGFSTNGTEKMRILSNGNVGIGISSPWDRFSVYQANGSVGASIISDNTSSNTARYPYLNVLNYLGSPANGAGGSPAISLINMRGNSSVSAAMQSSEALGSLVFNGSKDAVGGYNEGAAIWAITNQAFSNSAAGTSLLFYTTANDTTGSVSRMVIDQSGKVGIGVSTPTYALQVSGDISVSGSFKVNGVDISTGTVTSVTAASTTFNPITVGGSGAAPTIDIAKATASVNGYLSSGDWTTFSAKLSDFSTLLSSDITGKLGYVPVNPATAVLSVAGQTGVVTLSSSDITGLSFGTTAGTYAQGNDSRFTDTRTPTDNSVTSAKIFDGTITSADISAAAITFDKLNQSSATTGQVIKWSGSAWVASSDSTGSSGLPAAGGSDTAPGYAFIGDSNTGIFNSVADTLGFSTAGTERMRITADGKVGIGVTDPYFDFEVARPGTTTSLSVTSSGYDIVSGYSQFVANHYMGASNYGYPRVSFNNHRGVGGAPTAIQSGDTLSSFEAWGASDSAYSVRLGSSIEFRAEGNFSNSSAPASISFMTTPTGTTTPVERLNVSSAGNVGIGETAPANAKLSVAGTIVSTPPASISGASVDLANGNTQVLTAVGGSTITVSNMVHGGTYTLVIQDTTSRTYTFSGCNTSRFVPVNAATTVLTHSIYTLLTIYNGATYDCYITWASGY
jgi:hypothetical protein